MIQMLMGNEHRVDVLQMLVGNPGRMATKVYDPVFKQRVGQKPNVIGLDEDSRMS